MALAAPLPTGAVTFAFTDIEGSTTRWDRDRAAMQEAVRRHDAIMRAALTEHGGHVFKTVGDAFCAAFTHPADALAAMLDAQQKLAAEDFAAVDGLRVRMALHTGSADERDGDYFGPAVNRVARLLSLGHGGQILLSSATAELLGGSLPPLTTLRDLGVHHLKGIADPERVHQLTATDVATEFPPLRPSTAPDDLAIMDAEALYPVSGFSGREKELMALNAALANDRGTAVVHGLGGVGKSSIAREYGWRNRELYAVTWWLNAETEDGIVEGLLRLGTRFIPGLDEMKDRRAAAQRVIGSALGGFAKPVLLIFDNLEEEALLRTWRPHSGARLLLTSRSSTWGPEIVAIPVQALELDTAAGYLQRESARADLSAADAREIAETLGALPLALAHAAAYLRATRTVTPGRYLERITHHLKNTPRNAEYPRSVFATFNTAIAQAEREAAGAAAVLCFAACFAPDAIPEELFHQPIDTYAVGLKPMTSRGAALDLRSALANDVQLDEALSALDRLSLLAFSGNAGTHSMHRLVQLAAQDMTGDAIIDWRECAVAAADAAFPPDDFAAWPLSERLLPHARAALNAFPSHRTVLIVGHLAHQCGIYLWRRGEYSAAEALHERALAIREKALGLEHPEVGVCLNSLANAYREQGRYEEAAALHKRAFAIGEKALGAEHREVGVCLYNLAHVYYEQGRYDEAEALFKRALPIWEKALGPEHPDAAHGLNGLATVYYKKGRYDEAEALYKRALAIWEKALGPEHPDAAHGLNNLANVYKEQGRDDEAELLLKRALAIWEKALGPEHRELATSLDNLAGVYSDQGRYDEAESMYKRALAIREKALGPENPQIALSLNHLANVYREQHRFEEAEALQARALAIREKMLGSDHPDVATSLHDLATVYEAEGRSEDAEPLYVRALAIREKALGPDHPKTQLAREKLTALGRG